MKLIWKTQGNLHQCFIGDPSTSELAAVAYMLDAKVWRYEVRMRNPKPTLLRVGYGRDKNYIWKQIIEYLTNWQPVGEEPE